MEDSAPLEVTGKLVSSQPGQAVVAVCFEADGVDIPVDLVGHQVALLFFEGKVLYKHQCGAGRCP